MPRILVRLLVCLSILFSFAGCKANSASEAKNQPTAAKTATLQNTVQSKDLVVTVLNVGKADAILIQVSGKNYLIDTGLIENSKALVSHLRSLGVNELDKIFMTHPHKDHIGGMPALLNSFKIKQIYDTELINPDSKLYPKILKLIADKHITKTKIQAPMKIALAGGAYFEVLWPVEQKITVPNDSELNPNSLVMRLVYKDFTMMFAADSYKQSEERIIKLYPQTMLKVNVLKVGHHGSNTSTGDAWLDTLSPQVAAISYGIKAGEPSDKYPSKKTVERLKAHNIKAYGTFADGDIIIVTDGKEYSVKTDKN